MPKARLDENGKVIEILPHENFHPDLLSQCVDLPAGKGLDFVLLDGEWINPAPSAEHILDKATKRWIVSPAIARREIKNAAIAKIKAMDPEQATTIAQLKLQVKDLREMILSMLPE